MKKLLSLSIFILATAVAPAMAQTQDGSVSGLVRDEQGATVPGSDVSLRGPDATFQFVTETDGAFRFLNLQPGVYKVTATLSGFAPATRDVIVTTGTRVDVTLTLRIGGVTDTVTVSAPAPMLDAKSTGTATTRDVFSLVRTVPGVILDRVNVGGNETGQAPTIVSKGTRPQDTVWTLDGIVITDMAAAGQTPTYFNYDNCDEVQVSTAGQDIRQQTGGVGINMITKRGTNSFHGGVRGYFANESMEAGDDPTADHNKQLSDYSLDAGGPILSNRAWFYASYSSQDIQLVRKAGAVVDRTKLNDPEIKLNWQADRKDMISFLFFNGSKVKDYRSPATAG